MAGAHVPRCQREAASLHAGRLETSPRTPPPKFAEVAKSLPSATEPAGEQVGVVGAGSGIPVFAQAEVVSAPKTRDHATADRQLDEGSPLPGARPARLWWIAL
ncbi:hypothetical protein AB0D04_40285 [Streptomyces sp. NPDC048483]|uniref:hypothetical protein n=1 Tax=Streptomyces sp. NPDC048483 TaxID=3154927 RepID=UPI00341759C9